MSNIEPTEEQKQAARDLCSRSHIFRAPTDVEALARLLAEREAAAMCKGAAIAWGTVWDSSAPAEVIKVAEDVKGLHHRIERLTAHAKAADEGFAEREAKLRDEVATLNANNDQLVRDLKLSGFCYPASNVARFIVHDRLESSGDWYDPATSRIMHMDPAKAFAMKDEIDTLRARVAQAESAIDIFVANDDKCDTLLRRTGLDGTVNVVPRLAALVDETVALRARVAELEAVAGEVSDMRAQLDIADTREAQHLARIAELEADCGRLRADRYDAEMRCVGMEDREAQHLAGIKALLRSCCVAMDAIDDGDSVAARNELAEATERLAHYDDAKAAEGGEG